MSQPVATISLQAQVLEIAQKMADSGVSGLVVIDDEGRAQGIVSDGDLLHKVARTHFPPQVQLLGGVFFLELPHRFRALMDKIKGYQAKHLMSQPLVWSTAEVTAQDIADLMLEKKVRRIPILEDGRPVGMITRRDLVRHCLARP